MKLLYCEIIGFGNLKNIRFDFTEGLNVFLRENGWGKTTFCAFIKDMLYGLGEKRTKNVTENDRVKYQPWSGGVFGGVLAFTHNGKRYRVERSFGKTPSQDVLRVFDEQSKTLCYDFSAYGDNIGEALLGIDRDGFERALFLGGETLTPLPIDGNLKNALCRAITNSQGEDVDGAIERIEAAERDLKAKRRPAKGRIDEKEDAIYNVRKRRQAIEEQISSIPLKKQQILQLEDTVYALNKKIDGCATDLAMRGENGDAAIEQAKRAQLQAQIKESQNQLAQLTCFFNGVSPEQLNLHEIQAQTDGYYALKQRQESMRGFVEERAQIHSLNERKAELETALQSYRLAMQERGEEIPQVKPTKKGKGAGIIVFCLSLCSLLIGMLVLSANTVLSACLFAMGGVLFFIAVGMAKKIKKKGAGSSLNANSALQSAYLQALLRLQECEESLRKLQGEQGAEILQDEQKLARLLDEQKQRLTAYFAHFPFGQIYDFRAALQTLQEKSERYQMLRQSLQTKQAELQSLTENAGENVCEQTNFAPSQSLKTQLFSLQKQKDEALQKLHVLQREYDDLLLYKTQAEELDEEEKLLLDEQAALIRRYDVLQTAKALLLQAKNNLSDKYLTPVANACKSHLSAFGEKPFDICFDGNGSPLLKDGGFYRLPDFYSQGYRRLIDFCIRLSVAQTVYQSEPTLFIFDDPFAELDDKHFHAAKQFVRALAEKGQILYFTCTASRAM